MRHAPLCSSRALLFFASFVLVVSSTAPHPAGAQTPFTFGCDPILDVCSQGGMAGPLLSIPLVCRPPSGPACCDGQAFCAPELCAVADGFHDSSTVDFAFHQNSHHCCTGNQRPCDDVIELANEIAVSGGAIPATAACLDWDDFTGVAFVADEFFGPGCTFFCGDGFLHREGNDLTLGTSDDEECDDGNTTPGDGCAADCSIEPNGNPVPVQTGGNHSLASAVGGAIRDDQIASVVCDAIAANGFQVKDVKIFVNACYGGGIIDDFQREFGPGGGCAGIPWVGGSASTAEQVAYGYWDSVVDSKPERKLGSAWTTALFGLFETHDSPRPGAIYDAMSHVVKDDLELARNVDIFGPAGQALEDPVIGWANGGDMIVWNMPGAKHEAVVFGGQNDRPRHTHNVENVRDALAAIWAGSPHNIQMFDGGSAQDLVDALELAVSRLDADTQLVIYLNDHGQTTLDVLERDGLGSLNVVTNYQTSLALHNGWRKGLDDNHRQGRTLTPSLSVSLSAPISSGDWSIQLNGASIPLPGGTVSGQHSLPVPWQSIQYGNNTLDISAVGSPPGPFPTTQLQLHSGPIDDTLSPALPAASELGLALLVVSMIIGIFVARVSRTRASSVREV